MIGKITENANEFTKQLEKLVTLTATDISQIIRKVCFDLYTQIYEYTPKDTGRCASNWSITTDQPDENIYEDNTRKLTINDFNYAIEDEVVWITNNVEYTSVLEEGRGFRDGQMRGSELAPHGMVQISLAEFNERIRVEIQKFRDRFELI